MDLLSIPLQLNGNKLTLKIYPSSNNAKLFEVEQAARYGEARWQLTEGAEYEYELEQGFQFKEHELVRPSRSNASRGLIKTGIYVGCLTLYVTDGTSNETAISFEVQSEKIDYREDYKTMLKDITSHFTDLVMIQGSPVTQQFEVNKDEESKTLYQQFSFLKAIVDSKEFEEALYKIFYNPIHKWTGAYIDKDICSVKSLGRPELRQIASNTNRIPLSSRISLAGRINSVPRRLTVPYKKDTTDVAENRFVKFVLRSFLSFCSTIQQCKKPTRRLLAEAQATENKLAEWLSNSFFLDISDLQTISFNSPALQRKEGYRELLQAWIMSKLAAQITWKGGDNVYQAGKRNVAALYEYWVFFKLLDIVKTTFKIDLSKSNEEKLVHVDRDSINLDLCQGHMKMVGGRTLEANRIINVRLYYNRPFTPSDNTHKSGSWTTIMRPDYTLSLWPGMIEEEEAEEQDLIVHIHFDAKYKLKKELFEESITYSPDDQDSYTDQLNTDKQEEEKGIYKKIDLYKMHTYKDAIRRTSGAYIIYPGDKNATFRGFHEIIPGLGAFCLNPKNVYGNSKAIESFIQEILHHMLDRDSQRERLSFHTNKVYANPSHELYVSLPEALGHDRDLIPDETYVLIGSYKDNNHLKWILSNKIYNARTGTANGSLRLKKEISSAKYILLHKANHQLLLRLGDKGPRIFSNQELIKMKNRSLYTPSKPYYVVYDIASPDPENEFKDVKWDLTRMMKDGIIIRGRLSAQPQGITMATLMQYVKK